MNIFFRLFLLIIIISSCEKYESNCNDNPSICEDNLGPTTVNLSFPSSFPSPNTPTYNPITEEGVNLGRHLFYDPILSSDNTISCASCHKQESAFGDNSQYSFGVNQAIGDRHAPTIVNVAFQNNFDWDGKSSTLEEQAARPIFNEIELHNNNWIDVINRLKLSEIYPDLFCLAFGTEDIDSLHIVMAISQFERSLVSYNSRFDQWLNGQIMFTEEEIDGFNIYATERGDCFHCHPIGLFTDDQFHNNGLDSEFSDLGRYNITQNPLDQGLFKSPTLRNVEFSAPYMHDGRFNTLEEVIDHYNFGGYDSPTVDPLMKYVGVGLLLTDQEKANLKAFLLTLSDESFINNPNFSNPF